MNPESINKNVAYTSIVKFVSLGFGFFYSVLMLRLLGADGNGLYSLLTTNGHVAFLFLGFNSTSGLVFFIAKGKFKKEKIIGLIVLLFGIVTSVLVSILTILYVYDLKALALFLPNNYQNSFFLIILVSLFFIRWLGEFCASFALGSFLYKHFNRYVFYSSLVRVSILGIFYLAVQHGWVGDDLKRIFIILISTEFLLSIIYFLSLYFHAPFRISFQFSINGFIRPFFGYSLKGWVLGLLRFFTNRFFNWVVNYHYSLNSLGLLALSVGLFGQVQFMLTSINQGLMPFLIKLEIEEGKKRFLFFFRVTITASILLAVGVFFFAPFFIPFIFGEEFQGAVGTTQIIFFLTPFLSINALGRMYASSQNKHQFMIIAEGAAFLITVVGDLIFIPEYGIYGASWVMFAAYICSASIVVYILISRLNVPVLLNFIINQSDIAFFSKKIREYVYRKK